MVAATVAFVQDPYGLLGGALVAGDRMWATYRYALGTTDSNPFPTVGDYWHVAAPYGIVVRGRGTLFETNPDAVSFLVELVNNNGNPPRDNYLLRSYNNRPLPNGVSVDSISWQLDDASAAALASPALPAVPPLLPDWQSAFGLTQNPQFAVLDAAIRRGSRTPAVVRAGP